MATCLAVVAVFCAESKAQNIQPQMPQKAELYVQTGHTFGVNAVAFSPNSKTLASGSFDNTIKFWNTETGQELRTLAGHTKSVQAVVFSTDGRTLASGSADKTIKLWNAETGQELRTLAGHTSDVYTIVFSPDDKFIASGSRDKTIKLWRVETGQELKTLAGNIVAFAPDGKTLASAGDEDNDIRLWNVETGQTVRTFSGHTNVIKSVAFSPDGKTLASGSFDNTIKLWNVATGREVKTLAKHSDVVESVAFAPDGKTIASGSGDNTIKLWQVATGRELRTLAKHSDIVNSVAFAPDGKTLASGSEDKTIKLWNVATGRELRTLSGHISNAYALVFAPDGKTFASTGSGSDTTIKLWQVEVGQELRTLAGHTGFVRSVAFSFDGKTLASASDDKTIKLWSVETGQVLRTLAGHTDVVNSVAFAPDGKTIASTSDDKTIKLWSVATGQLLSTLSGHTDIVRASAFSPDGQVLASVGGHADSTIKLWSVATGQEIRKLSGHTKWVFSVAFAPDGKTLASASEDKTVKLWSVETGQELRTLSGHNSAVFSVAFAPDGKIIASGSEDKAIKLWRAETGQLIKSFAPDDPDSMREVFSVVPDYRFINYEPIRKDGRFQIRRGDNEKIDVYAVNTGKLLASLIAVDTIDWAVVLPDGRFDGSPNAWKLLSWRLSDRLYDIAPIEAFFNEFYRPGLLQDIFAGRNIEPPTRDIATIDIRQPEVNVVLADATQNVANVTTRQTTINIEVKDAPADKRRRTTSGAKDVRLFRNGALVKLWRGDVLNGKQSIPLTATVPLVAGDNTFTAYAFNNENVKSSDSELMVEGADALKRKGTAYILAIGVNEYANSQYNLRYAVADAQAFTAEVQRQQEALGRYAQVEVMTLLDSAATKANVLRALAQLAAKVQPEDAVVIYYAGHGTAQGNRFYLIPHDLGYTGARDKVDAAGLQQVLAHSISDEELEAVFERIDAGQLLMVLDACNSGQALEAEEKRRGPMNSKGLAQLAYEKGMYILTAAQSFQAAQEAAQVGHGLLTYALIEEGLKQGAADSEPKDGQIGIREWLDYATGRVPQMQVAKMKAARGLGLNLSFKEEERGLEVERRSGQQPRVFYRRELEVNPLLIATPPPASSGNN